MHYFRAASFSAPKFFAVSDFEKAYFEEYQKNRLFMVQVSCGDHVVAISECMQKYGVNNPEQIPVECQNELFRASLCSAGVLAPVQYAELDRCGREATKNGKDPVEECSTLIEGLMKEGERQGNLLAQQVQQISPEEQSTMNSIKSKCGYPFSEEMSANDIMSCVGPIVCPGPISAFVDCVGKNGNDYASPACVSKGKAVAACMGKVMRYSPRVYVIYTDLYLIRPRPTCS